MELKIFTVRDLVAEVYLEPFFAQNAAAAIRGFADASSTEGHQFNKHSTDFALYQIGSFNTENGFVTACEPIKLASAFDFTGPMEVVTDA